MWTRTHKFEWDSRTIDQREEYYLVDTTLFEPTMERNPPLGELSAFRGFRWWSIEEIRDSTELFAPWRLTELLDTVVQSGPPKAPYDVGI